ncbi:MAG: sugar phosphate isomerase/epimerase family protein [Ardenticatenaceae bacterium]
MKYGVFTVMLPDLTPEEAAQELKASGYDGVEWRVTRIPPARVKEAPSFWGNNLCTFAPTEAEARRARGIAESVGLEILSLGTYIEVGDVAATEEAMRFAQIAGAPQIRVGVGRTPSDKHYGQLFAQSKAFLTEVEALARDYNVKALVEIHHRTITPSASLAHRLLSHFDPEWIGAIHDAGNMVHEGFENYQMGLELLGPYLAHVHIKNGAFRRPEGGGVWKSDWAPLDDGVVDFDDLFAALRAVSYDQWLVIEDFSQARPSREALRHNLAFLRTRKGAK